MKRVFAVVAVAVVLVAGLFINNVGDGQAVISADDAPAADSQLPELGPIRLVAASYSANQTIACSDPGMTGGCLGGFSVVSDFQYTAPVSIECSLNGMAWVPTGVDVCVLAPGNTIIVSMSWSRIGPDAPCDNLPFMNVVLENADGDTLTVYVTSSLDSGCFIV